MNDTTVMHSVTRSFITVNKRAVFYPDLFYEAIQLFFFFFFFFLDGKRMCLYVLLNMCVFSMNTECCRQAWGGGVGRRWQTRCKSFREILLTWCHIAYFDSPTATRRSCDVKKKTKKNQTNNMLIHSDVHKSIIYSTQTNTLMTCVKAG